MYTLRQAAESTGKSKQTLLRAIRTGKISARKDENGQWTIDPSELHRVYETLPCGTSPTHHEVPLDTPAIQQDVVHLRAMLEERDKRIVDKEYIILGQETMIQSLEAVISDLMERLDHESADRRRAFAQLTGLLTHQSMSTERRWWWPWHG